MFGVRSFAFTVVLVVALVEAHEGIINNAFLVLGLDQAKLSQILKDSNLLAKLGLNPPCEEKEKKQGGGGGAVTVLPHVNSTLPSKAEEEDLSAILNGNFKFNFDPEKNKNEKCLKYIIGEDGQKSCHDFLAKYKLEKAEELQFKDFFDFSWAFHEEVSKANSFGTLKSALQGRNETQTLHGVFDIIFNLFQSKVTERTSKLNEKSVDFFKQIGGVGAEWAKNVWGLWLKASPAVKSNLAGLCSVTTNFVQHNSTQKIFAFSYNYTYTVSG
ncbi:unnamed protein product [Bursaphelenchus xylophilus]|uniref:(pine wood nematode) hypothetical protein n=1 Tax=Bursaphelenchus xylophilus TaxID=6326 RepID=A0A1I7RK92_BURXY|nr:unnamed protein product [Bursaphelenchus xylophilus]CAG9131414.1 unnamed protein product [Bursaphelenchus xylophilus]